MEEINPNERLRRTLCVDGNVVACEDRSAFDFTKTDLSNIEDLMAHLEIISDNANNPSCHSLHPITPSSVHVAILFVERYKV